MNVDAKAFLEKAGKDGENMGKITDKPLYMRNTALILQDYLLVILDEGQAARKSNHLFNAAGRLQKQSKMMVLLTATPIMTGPKVRMTLVRSRGILTTTIGSVHAG